MPFAREICFGLRIVKQRQRTVTEQGRRWILYELELERQGGGPKPPIEIPPISMVIRVNPEKMLPDSWTITQGKFKVTQPDSKTITREAVKVELAFDYPAEGPADIYALGVPRDAPVEDRMPPPDLDRIIKIVQQTPARFRQLSCHCRRKQRTQVWHRAPDSVQRRQVSCRRWHRRHQARGVRG